MRGFIIKLFVGSALLYLLSLKVDLNKMLDAFKKVDFYSFYLSLASFWGILIFQSFRLHLLIKPFSKSFKHTFGIVLTGVFFNNLLPSSFWGDSYKVYYLYKQKVVIAKSVTLIFLDRLIGIAVLAIVGGLFTLANFNTIYMIAERKKILIASDDYFLYLVCLIMVIFSIITLYKTFGHKFYDIRNRISTFLNECKEDVYSISFGKYILIVFLSICSIVFRILKFYFMLSCFDIDIGVDLIVVIIFISNIISLLPISVGSLGVMEGSILFGLTFFDVSMADAAGIAVLNRIGIWLFAFLGGAVYALSGIRGAKTT